MIEMFPHQPWRVVHVNKEGERFCLVYIKLVIKPFMTRFPKLDVVTSQ